MIEKNLEKQPNAKQLTLERKEETQDCHFIPELNRIDFFSRVRASHLQSRSSKPDLFTQTDFGGHQPSHVDLSSHLKWTNTRRKL